MQVKMCLFFTKKMKHLIEDIETLVRERIFILGLRPLESRVRARDIHALPSTGLRAG